ncbi:XseB Exonuclease VII small subunit [Burkholderiales bacterium]
MDQITALSFEDAMTALERETARLEGGQLALADALKAYERGVALMRHAQTLLETAQKELEVIDAKGTSRVLRSDILGESP